MKLSAAALATLLVPLAAASVLAADRVDFRYENLKARYGVASGSNMNLPEGGAGGMVHRRSVPGDINSEYRLPKSSEAERLSITRDMPFSVARPGGFSHIDE
ncbi:hypothetical protein [Roseibium sp. RKSG952]|uniref:hypothetical protein n=1 Tax=Roseibium sp. RKSG952 TaxID=2529384 RepID=UPI0012BC0288|nr:hypothetical protein [Roseibium sp. RKSG952]MTH95987.1 hypothetical protein [Roseibium sp. RKSG952]